MEIGRRNEQNKVKKRTFDIQTGILTERAYNTALDIEEVTRLTRDQIRVQTLKQNGVKLYDSIQSANTEIWIHPPSALDSRTELHINECVGASHVVKLTYEDGVIESADIAPLPDDASLAHMSSGQTLGMGRDAWHSLWSTFVNDETFYYIPWGMTNKERNNIVIKRQNQIVKSAFALKSSLPAKEYEKYEKAVQDAVLQFHFQMKESTAHRDLAESDSLFMGFLTAAALAATYTWDNPELKKNPMHALMYGLVDQWVANMNTQNDFGMISFFMNFYDGTPVLSVQSGHKNRMDRVTYKLIPFVSGREVMYSEIQFSYLENLNDGIANIAWSTNNGRDKYGLSTPLFIPFEKMIQQVESDDPKVWKELIESVQSMFQTS